jgi:hypothetical protein
MESVVKDLPNISDVENLTHIPYFLAGILLVDTCVLFITRYFPEKVGGASLNDWYDLFGLEGVMADVFIILIGFVIAQFIYTFYIMPTFGWKPLYFILLAVGVQVIHDLLFYHGVIKPLPKGENDMIDTYKKYAEENGGKIIPGDSLLVILSGAATFALESVPPYVAAGVAILTLYTLPYILNTKRKGTYVWTSPEVKAAAESEIKKEEQKKLERPITPWDMLKPQVQSTKPQSMSNW